MNTKIWLSSPHMGDAELRYVHEAFASNWVAPLGPHVDGFEKAIGAYLGGNVHVAALNSGTAAIHLALMILGVGHGDEVLCQSMTFSASANPIIYAGATPVFIDSEQQTWNMCPDHLAYAIGDRIKKGRRPKAIIVVHLYGMPAKMDQIMTVARHYQIPVIEDAAEALGSIYKGRKAGTLGDIGIVSFNGNKIITTSGGGALIARNEQWVERARFLATQARDAAPHYEHSNIGYNYRLSNVCAGIGIGQMEVLPQRVLQRRQNFQFYKDEYAHLAQITFQEEQLSHFSNRWLTCILIDGADTDREKVRQALASENIESRPLWKPMHLQPVFKKYPFYCTGISENLFNRGLCLPSGSNLTNGELKRVVNHVKSCFYAIPVR